MSVSEKLSTKALMVFCEGPHDVAFCRLVFGKLLKTEKFEHRFADFPAPLNDLLKTNLENHLLQDMSLDMAHKFFLPDSVLRLEQDNVEWLVLLFNCGGKDRIDNPKGFLENYLELSEQAAVFPGNAAKVISESRYLFLYDVDDQQPQQVIEQFARNFAEIAEESWITETPQMLEGFDNAAVSEDKAVYLWSHKNDDGEPVVVTLEDIVLPLFQSAKPELSESAEMFINETFNWDRSSISAEAKRKKAVITALGQKKKPGGSMNVILEQSKLFKEQHLAESSYVQVFCGFLTQLMEIREAA